MLGGDQSTHTHKLLLPQISLQVTEIPSLTLWKWGNCHSLSFSPASLTDLLRNGGKNHDVFGGKVGHDCNKSITEISGSYFWVNFFNIKMGGNVLLFLTCPCSLHIVKCLTESKYYVTATTPSKPKGYMCTHKTYRYEVTDYLQKAFMWRVTVYKYPWPEAAAILIHF